MAYNVDKRALVTCPKNKASCRYGNPLDKELAHFVCCTGVLAELFCGAQLTSERHATRQPRSQHEGHIFYQELYIQNKRYSCRSSQMVAAKLRATFSQRAIVCPRLCTDSKPWLRAFFSFGSRHL